MRPHAATGLWAAPGPCYTSGMSAEAAALLRAIRDCPDDDLPRLALADWLEEAGDPDRAAFLRAQVELSRLAEDDPRRPELEDREHELLAEHEADWLAAAVGNVADTGSPESVLTGWRFERGFITEVAATPLFLLDRGRDLFAGHPVRRWRVCTSRLWLLVDPASPYGRLDR